ncbi:hypothetical protein Dsin_023172 [Dipteronia sinensis]|uniref:Uncharacterized protein n=1 Tax=Dipteronia sinensis TaxID=43782 RepID=A0AAE0A3R7_9ROSI|nr:hypothetical protein Dsin_023172 [Dipteronia sinensis]
MGVDPDESLIEEVDNDISNELEESDDENVDENATEVCNNFMSDDEDATRGESIRDTLVFEMWRDYYRATGAGAETAKEKRKRWDNGSRYNYETVEGIDLLLSQNEVTLESFDRMDDYINTMFSSLHDRYSITILPKAASELDGLICKVGFENCSFVAFMTVFVLLLL